MKALKMESRLEELISTAIQELMGEGYIEALFLDTVVFSAYRPGGYALYEIPWSVDAGKLTLGEPTSVELDYVAKRMSDELGPALDAPIVFKNEEERIVYGPVLIPGEPDSDGEVVSKAKVREVAHKFMRDYQNVDVSHTLNNVASPVESYITPMDMTFKGRGGDDVQVPEGSWMMGAYVEADKEWEAAKTGELNGFSIMGVPKKAVKSGAPSMAIKKVLLGDLGDWLATHVSMVKRPAVYKAEWLAVKERGKLARLLGRKEDKTPPEPVAAKEDDMEEKDVLAAIKAANDELADSTKETAEKSEERLAALESRLAALESRLEELAKKGEETEPEPTEPESLEALKAQIEKLGNFQTEVAKRLDGKVASKAAKGQDEAPGDEEPQDFGGRNAMGVKSR